MATMELETLFNKVHLSDGVTLNCSATRDNKELLASESPNAEIISERLYGLGKYSNTSDEEGGPGCLCCMLFLQEYDDHLEDEARLAINKHNEENGPKLDLVKVMKVIEETESAKHIILEAKEKDADDSNTTTRKYEAKIGYGKFMLFTLYSEKSSEDHLRTWMSPWMSSE